MVFNGANNCSRLAGDIGGEGGGQVDGMPHDDGLMTREHHHACPFLSEFSPFSYHQNSVKHFSDMYEYINAGKTDEI
jgi:hypothetical protein